MTGSAATELCVEQCTRWCSYIEAVQGYDGLAQLSVDDVKVGGGGGVAKRLHTSCCHLVAVAEVK